MPLTPSPETVATVQAVQQDIDIQRWEDSDAGDYHERTVVLSSTTGRSALAENSLELTRQEELYELAQALHDQVGWLSYNDTGPEATDQPCDWCVTRMRHTEEGDRIEVIGPMTRTACTPEWWDGDDILWVSASPLTRPPLV